MTPDPAVPAEPTKPGLLNGARLNYYIGRVVVVLTALAVALPTATVVLTDGDWTTVAGVAVGVAALIPVVVKFLDGVQQHEKAGYQFDLQTQQANAQLSIIAAEEEAAGRIGGARSQSKIATPGR